MAIANFGPGTFVWTDGPPTHDPDNGAKFAVDKNTYVQYEWVSGTTWVESPISVKKISGTSAPTGAPGLHDSQLAINEVPELYYYFSGSWHLVSSGGGGSYTEGEGIDITAGVISLDTLDRVRFNQAPTLAGGERIMRWNDTDGTLEFVMKGGNVTQQIGQELPILVKNADNAGLTDGTVVYVVGSDGANKTVRLAKADSETTSANTFGVMTESATGGNKAFCTTFGMVHNIDTSALTEGAMIYLSATTAGAMTTTRPTAPNHAVQIGFCIRSHATQGVIFVTVQNGYELGELHNVAITSPAADNVLAYNSGTGAWVNTPGVLASTTAGGDLSGTFSNLQIIANAVGTTEIADDAVTSAKIAANAVGSSELQSTTVVPGSYTYSSLTVDADGRLTSASSGTTPLAAVTTDASLIGTGTGGSPLGISFPILAPDGSAAAPSYAFVNSAESGLFYESPNLKLSTAAAVNISAKPGLGGELSLLTQAESGATAPQINVIAGNSDSRDGGRVNIYSGDGSSGGVLDIKSGTGTSGPGGDIFITGGDSTGADGSNIAIVAGSSDQNGGDITITSGASTDLNGGDFTVQAGGGAIGGGFSMFSGAGTTGSGGSFSLNAGNSTSSGGGAFNAAAGNGVDGGGFSLFAGDGTASGGAFTMESGSGVYGGNFIMSCGTSNVDEDSGGSFSMQASTNSGTDGEGGQFYIKGGDAPNGFGGNITITPGQGASQRGIVVIANQAMLRAGTFTTTQRDALTGTIQGGSIIFNVTTQKLQVYASGAWVDLH